MADLKKFPEGYQAQLLLLRDRLLALEKAMGFRTGSSMLDLVDQEDLAELTEAQWDRLLQDFSERLKRLEDTQSPIPAEVSWQLGFRLVTVTNIKVYLREMQTNAEEMLNLKRRPLETLLIAAVFSKVGEDLELDTFRYLLGFDRGVIHKAVKIRKKPGGETSSLDTSLKRLRDLLVFKNQNVASKLIIRTPGVSVSLVNSSAVFWGKLSWRRGAPLGLVSWVLDLKGPVRPKVLRLLFDDESVAELERPEDDEEIATLERPKKPDPLSGRRGILISEV